MSFHLKNKVRVSLFFLGVIAVVFTPPWVPLIVMVAAALRYAAWEVLLIGLFADLVWLPALPVSLPLFTIASLVLVWGFEPLRREFLLGKGNIR